MATKSLRIPITSSLNSLSFVRAPSLPLFSYTLSIRSFNSWYRSRWHRINSHTKDNYNWYPHIWIYIYLFTAKFLLAYSGAYFIEPILPYPTSPRQRKRELKKSYFLSPSGTPSERSIQIQIQMEEVPLIIQTKIFSLIPSTSALAFQVDTTSKCHPPQQNNNKSKREWTSHGIVHFTTKQS